MNVFSPATLVAPAAPRPPRARRPWAQLLNAVLDLAGPRAEFVSHAERPWASVTFVGSRHISTLAFPGARGVIEGERFAEALPEHEFAIPRQIVTDAVVTGMRHESEPAERVAIEIELLLVEDL